MRFFAGLTSFLLALLAWGAAGAQTPPDVRDPFFGVRIAAAQMRLERAAAAFLDDCGVGRPSIEQMSWIFAEADTPQGRFVALGGLSRRVRHGRAEPWIQNWKGELVVVRGTRCTLIDPPREALTNPGHATVPLSDEAVTGLAEDAVARLTRQFGSRAALVAALRAQGVYPTSGPPALRAALERGEQ